MFLPLQLGQIEKRLTKIIPLDCKYSLDGISYILEGMFFIEIYEKLLPPLNNTSQQFPLH